MEQRRKILVLLVARGAGGLEKRFSNLFKYFCLSNPNPNIDITYLVTKTLVEKMKGAYQVELPANIHYRTFGGIGSGFIGRICDYICLFIILLSYKIRNIKFDCVHFSTVSSLFFLKLVNSHKRVYSFVDSSSPEKLIDMPRLKRIFSNNIHIDCLSEDIKRKLIEQNFIPPEFLHVAPCSFADYSLCHIKPKKPVIAFSGRLDENKGIKLLMEALPRMLNENPDARFLIMGWGKLEEYVKQTLREMDNHERVYMCYHINPCEMLAETAIFLSLQKRENYPSQSLLEAMACGNSIIATDVGLTRKLISDDVGFLIGSNSDELAKAVKIALLNWEQTIERGLRARNKVIKEHSVTKFAEYIIDLWCK